MPMLAYKLSSQARDKIFGLSLPFQPLPSRGARFLTSLTLYDVSR